MNEGTARVRNVRIDARRLSVELTDGRTVTTPLVHYPTLLRATERERSVFEVYPRSIHWPLLDVDVGVKGLLAVARELPCYARKRSPKARRAHERANARTLD